ncbi:MAG: PilT protein [Microvirga sp.]|nr:PilT protein [Microvirga sp.]
MGVIFDGRIWLGLAAGVMNRQAVIAAAGEAPVFTSAISLGELRFGVEVCSDPNERAIRAAWLRQVEVLPGHAIIMCGSQPRPSSTATHC